MCFLLPELILRSSGDAVGWNQESPTVQYLKRNESGQCTCGRPPATPDRGQPKSSSAVLHDEMNSCYALWYLEPISLDTHRCVSIRSSSNKLKSAEVRGVASAKILTLGVLVVRPPLPLLLNSGLRGLYRQDPVVAGAGGGA